MKNGRVENGSVQEFLESAGTAALECKRLRRRLKVLTERRAEFQTQRRAGARKIARLICDEWERELAAVEREQERYRTVEAFLEQIPDEMYRMILRRRYLDVGLSWEEIRERLEEDGVFYSQRHITRLHTQALEAAQLLWDRVGKEGESLKRR